MPLRVSRTLFFKRRGEETDETRRRMMRRRGPPFRFFSTREKSETANRLARAALLVTTSLATRRLFSAATSDCSTRARATRDRGYRSASNRRSLQTTRRESRGRKSEKGVRERATLTRFFARRFLELLSDPSFIDTPTLKDAASSPSLAVSLPTRTSSSPHASVVLRYRSAMETPALSSPSSVVAPLRRAPFDAPTRAAYQGMGRNSSSEPSEICSWSTK